MRGAVGVDDEDRSWVGAVDKVKPTSDGASKEDIDTWEASPFDTEKNSVVPGPGGLSLIITIVAGSESAATSTGMSISDALRDMAGTRIPRLERRRLRLRLNSEGFYSRTCCFPIFVYFPVTPTTQPCWNQGFGFLSCISYHYTLQ